jgi:signal transduction histidine kinase
MQNSALKILCLEDVEADAIIIREKLRSDGLVFSFDHVSTEEAYAEKLASGSYDIILSDYSLPGYSGIAALMLARKVSPDTPVIFISGTIGEDMAVEMIHIGAADYILKDHLSKLPVAIERALKEAEEHKLRIEAEKSIEKLNQHLEEVREEERASIAREIHDQLGQSLTALKIDVEWLTDRITSDAVAADKLKVMNELIIEMSSDVQRIASELRPSILDDLGLATAMEWYIGEFSRRTGIFCQKELEEVENLNEKKSLTLYRVLQEALTNITRHAKATKVRVSLKRKGETITLTVTDNGIGISADKIDSYKSMGLLGIRERLKKHSGQLKIKSDKNKGTSLIISIPVN